MSDLASVEKLRKYTLCDKGERFTAYINADELADEIEREVSERFMEAPVDAETIRNQQEQIAELQVENAKLWRMNENIGAELANFGEQRDKVVAERDELQKELDIANVKLVGKPDCDICNRTTLLEEIEGLTAEREELRAAIAEKYMALPMDADGVPIHVGDTMQLGDTCGKVVALTYCPSNGKLPWEWQCDTGDWYNTAFARHVKPRTIEDVLDEFLHTAADACAETNCELEEQIAKYAAELRGMMEVDDD